MRYEPRIHPESGLGGVQLSMGDGSWMVAAVCLGPTWLEAAERVLERVYDGPAGASASASGAATLVSTGCGVSSCGIDFD